MITEMENASNVTNKEVKKGLSHIVGTFLIDASASHLNGGGLGSGEYDNYAIVKTFKDGQHSRGYYYVPFVSAASWRRWLRDTLIEETGLPASQIRALHKNPKGNTDKIGTERNPIEYIEDDVFGYMYPISKEDQARDKKAKAAADDDEDDEDEANGNGNGNSGGSKEDEALTIRGVFRTSAFTSSILKGLRKDGWEGKDQNYVSLIEGSSQPYKTQFMNCPLQGVFTLDFSRLGVYTNLGDRLELDQQMIDRYLASQTIVERSEHPEFYGLEKESIAGITEEKAKHLKKKPKQYYAQTKKLGVTYELTNAAQVKHERASAVLNSLVHLRGGAKQAAFGTDVAPKAIALVGLSCGNPILNNIFEDNSINPTVGKNVFLNIGALKEIIKDYSDRIVTDVIIGIRTGYMQNEQEIRELEGTEVNGIKIQVTTPIDTARQMAELL